MIKPKLRISIILITLMLFNVNLFSQETADSTIENKKTVNIDYGKKGFELKDKTGDYLMHLEFRGQFRISYPFDSDPRSSAEYLSESINTGISRARFKVGGHSFKPWLKYYIEYELQESNLLDFRIMIEKKPWLKVKFGQWKVQYNRERIISSGKQQTMERSILTWAFTLDRQQGISIFGNIGNSGLSNFSYWISAFAGTGRGTDINDNNQLMYMSRLQWNPSGKELKFTGSDLSRHNKFVGLIAIAGVTNTSPYTRFSQSGGGQLVGFDEGENGQYTVNQAMQETAFMYKGISWQQELHYKHINDNVNKQSIKMLGNLIQAGYFINSAWERFPEEVELFARQAFYYPEIAQKQKINEEYTAGINWFINDHRFKFTGEASYLKSEISVGEKYSKWRYRVQCDVSL